MRFSVIIPVYNKAETIKDSLSSILSQSFGDYEIIVVDDGSTDALDDAIEQFSGINLVRQENSGVSVARNTGILAASGEYVCFLDADDTWLNSHLETLSDMIEKFPDKNYYVTSHRTVFPDGKTVESSKCLKDIVPNEFIIPNLFEYLNNYSDGLVHTNSICVKRSALLNHKLFFEPNEKIGEDTDMWYRIALKEEIAFSKNVTTVYRREYSTATRISSNTQDWIFARRLPDILDSKEIPDDVKRECILLIDRYNLTCCRELNANGSGHEARNKLKQIHIKRGRRYILTYILCHLPSRICRIILNRRS